MLKKLFRTVFTLVGAGLGYGVFAITEYLFKISRYPHVVTDLSQWQEMGIALLFVIIFGFIFFKLTPLVNRQSKKVSSNIESELQSFSTNEVMAGIIGLVMGLIVAYLISQIYSQIKVPYLPAILSVATYLILGYLGVVIFTKRGKDILPSIVAARRAEKAGTKKEKKADKKDVSPKIFDTSVIIDGRIADIMKTGFLEGKIVIPEFVLVELRHIADSSDSLKRNRGRRGLDVLKRIESEHGIEIYNSDGVKELEEIPEVDIKLLKLAQMMNGKVVTNDFNLNKVAGIKGVEVLNINELANTLKPVVLPGEDMTLFLVKEGKERNQAVGYLDDGTMIVVEEGRKYIGKTIDITVTSVLQTAAGRMIFGKPVR
ncbi:MAG: DUF475 domain-containing protein [Eubacteriaceae bacterium]|jgi:uncharacterized protein YacL|nr:DUF475 domain-containing protein [Eubacteriaceae bacterium]